MSIGGAMDLNGRFIFGHTVEALFHRALAGRIAPECASSLKRAGLDLQAPLEPAYPLAKWIEWVEISAVHLFPERSIEEAHQLLGEELVEGYRATPLGQSLFSLLQILGPHKAVARMARNFQTGNSYTQVRLERTGPTRYHLWMNETAPYPQFVQGIIEAGMRAVVAESAKVELVEQNDDGVLYELSWGAPTTVTHSAESGEPAPRH